MVFDGLFILYCVACGRQIEFVGKSLQNLWRMPAVISQAGEGNGICSDKVLPFIHCKIDKVCQSLLV